MNNPTYLVHHGIKGQKWGVRRFQNYNGKRTPAGKERYGKQSSNASTDNTNHRVRLVDRLLSKNNVKAGSEELVYFATEAAVMLAYVGFLLYNNKRNRKKFDAELEEDYANRNIKDLKSAPRLKKPMPAEESMKIVNPGYPDVGTTANCMICTTAMVMREKGYDVKAIKSDHGFYNSNFEKLFDGSKFQKMTLKRSTELPSVLAKEGDGAYGNLTVTWNLGGGHSVFWKNENGRTRIYDSQSGEEYDVSDVRNSKFLRSISSSGCEYARLDNVEPNEKVLGVLTK